MITATEAREITKESVDTFLKSIEAQIKKEASAGSHSTIYMELQRVDICRFNEIKQILIDNGFKVNNTAFSELYISWGK